jgi:hypothetical protein
VRFAKSYAIPRANVKVVFDELGVLETKFAEARTQFLVTYDEEKQRWADQYPGYEQLIETELLPKAAVEAKLSFGYTPFCINDVDDELSQAVANRGSGPIVLGLSAQLFLEVAMQTRDLIKRSLFGRNEVTQKFLRPLRAIREKLAGLAFLDATVTPLVDTIDTVLAQLPARGKITGVPLEALRGVLSLLTDVNKMRQHAQLLLSGDANGLAFDNSDAGLFGVVTAGSDADVDADDEAQAPGDAADEPSITGPTVPKQPQVAENPLFF